MNKLLRVIGWPFSRFLSWIWRLFLGVLRRSMSTGVTGTASQFAYNAFLATVPFLFVVVTSIRLAGPDAYVDVFDKLEETIPGINGLAPAFNKATATGTAAGFVIFGGAIAGLYLASNALGALVDGLDRAQHLPHRRWIRAKAINLLFAAGTLVLAIVSMLALAGGERLLRGIADLFGANRSVQNVVDSLTLPVGVTALFMFILLLYRFGPNEMRLGFRAILPGAILATGAWIVTTRLVGLYAKAFGNLDSVYGTLGAIFVYLTFLYFSGLMFLVGAELNAELINRRVTRAARRNEEALERQIAATAQAARSAASAGSDDATTELAAPPAADPFSRHVR